MVSHKHKSNPLSLSLLSKTFSSPSSSLSFSHSLHTFVEHFVSPSFISLSTVWCSSFPLLNHKINPKFSIFIIPDRTWTLMDLTVEDLEAATGGIDWLKWGAE